MSERNIPTGPRWDRYGEFRYLGHVIDKYNKRVWIVARRKGESLAFALSLDEWLALSPVDNNAVVSISEIRGRSA